MRYLLAAAQATAYVATRLVAGAVIGAPVGAALTWHTRRQHPRRTDFLSSRVTP